MNNNAYDEATNFAVDCHKDTQHGGDLMVNDNCRSIAKLAQRCSQTDTEYFNRVHEDADRDIGACIDHIRDIAGNVLRDVLRLSNKECSSLSLEACDRHEEGLRNLLNMLVWVSVDQQMELAKELELAGLSAKGQGLSDRVAQSSSTEIPFRAIA